MLGGVRLLYSPVLHLLAHLLRVMLHKRHIRLPTLLRVRPRLLGQALPFYLHVQLWRRQAEIPMIWHALIVNLVLKLLLAAPHELAAVFDIGCCDIISY